MSNWKFAESLGRSRLDLLSDAPPFEDIARSIVKSLRIACTHIDPCREADGFSRFVACLVVERQLFDIFFNSYNGYRGWYYRSPSEGLRINAQLLRLLGQQLVDYRSHDGFSNDWTLKSLLAPSAKVWLAEDKKVQQACTGCRGEWSPVSAKDLDEPEILNGVWERVKKLEAKWGCKAPFFTKLKAIGAFLDDRSNEWIPSDKRFRARDIHEFGWS